MTRIQMPLFILWQGTRATDKIQLHSLSNLTQDACAGHLWEECLKTR